MSQENYRDIKGRFIKGHSLSDGHSVTEETRQKISDTLRGRKNPEHSQRMRGKRATLETRLKMSEAQKKIGNHPPIGKGDKSSNWRGGVTSFNLLERRRFRKELHQAILIRDNFTCQICGIRGVKLHVDHILKWSMYPELRFVKENCRALCRLCHYRITYGRELKIDTGRWCPS